MKSRKLSATSKKPPSAPRFLADRNLGRYLFVDSLKGSGVDITPHDDVYDQLERDPWIFYECGKGVVVITADTLFMKYFPHMAAIELGRTKIVAFANSNSMAAMKAKAFRQRRRQSQNMLRLAERMALLEY